MDLSGAYPDVLVLVGTQTGNSETVADAVAAQLGDVGFSCHVTDMAEAYPEMLADYRQLVVVVCTWADGTFPDNTVDFYDALTALGPSLDHLAYGVVGLGDRDYAPYYQTAAYRLVNTLDGLGAHRVIDVHEVEGVPGPRTLEAAEAWALQCGHAFAAAHA